MPTAMLSRRRSTTIDNTARNPNGIIANETVGTTSADGRTRTLSFDWNGDGIVDQLQTDVRVDNPDGGRTETLIDRTGAGVLVDSTVTTTSADGKTVTIQRDFDGDGLSDESEIRTTHADGSKAIAIANLNPDGSPVSRATTSTSADGLTQT